MLRSLVGSEMCIRDSSGAGVRQQPSQPQPPLPSQQQVHAGFLRTVKSLDTTLLPRILDLLHQPSAGTSLSLHQRGYRVTCLGYSFGAAGTNNTPFYTPSTLICWHTFVGTSLFDSATRPYPPSLFPISPFPLPTSPLLIFPFSSLQSLVCYRFVGPLSFPV